MRNSPHELSARMRADNHKLQEEVRNIGRTSLRSCVQFTSPTVLPCRDSEVEPEQSEREKAVQRDEEYKAESKKKEETRSNRKGKKQRISKEKNQEDEKIMSKKKMLIRLFFLIIRRKFETICEGILLELRKQR